MEVVQVDMGMGVEMEEFAYTDEDCVAAGIVCISLPWTISCIETGCLAFCFTRCTTWLGRISCKIDESMHSPSPGKNHDK